jgi:lipopolysaccharide export system protein LptA
MSRRFLRLAVATGLICAIVGPVYLYAQTTAGQVPNTGEPKRLGPREGVEKKNDIVRIEHADHARYDSKRGLVYLFGNVQFQDEKDVKLYCDEATYNKTDDTAACAGNLKVVDPDNTITGQMMNADFGAEIVDIQGTVKIITTRGPKEKTENGEDKKRTTTINCDKVHYIYTNGKRHAVATGNLTAVQEDKTATADRAEYDIERDVIVLTGPIKITWQNGDWCECTKAAISVGDEAVEDMEGFRGIFSREKKNEAEAKPAPATGGGG